MAEAVISVISEFVLERLYSLVHEDISLLCDLQKELERLEQTVSRIRAVLSDAEEKRDLSHQEIYLVKELKDVLYDVDDLLDLVSFDAISAQRRQGKRMACNALANRACVLFSKLKHASSLENIKGRLDAIVKDLHIRIDPSERRRPAALVNRETFSVEHEKLVIGRDREAAAIKELLLDLDTAKNVSVISLVGFGGLGKTTLARLVFNDPEVKEQFLENSIWVYVSENFDVKVIVQKIIKSITGQRPQVEDMEPLQQHLRLLIGGKKYLLVLDDVWSEDRESWDLLKTLLSGGAQGSKIVITTRSEGVGDAVGADNVWSLEVLSNNDAWKLFMETVFQQRQEEIDNPQIENIGEQVVKKCGGVPLAIKTIGELLSTKSYLEWQQFQDQELSSIIRAEDSILSILQLSYNYLEPHLKQCFAYCSLFPKEYVINRETLIRLWIAQGFIQPSDGNQHLEDIGNQYFMQFLSRSFFQNAS